MKKQVKKILENLGYSIKKYNKISDNERLLLRYDIPKQDIVFGEKTAYLKKIELTIDILSHSFILEGYSYLLLLSQDVGATFDLLENGKIEVKIQSCRVYINTWEEILILKEIYIDGIYNFYLENIDDFIFIDIGMNVGFTTLFFAKKKGISKIYSFEPFPDTYNIAIENIKLNDDVSSKIIPSNFGLGSNNRTERWDYNPDYKGSMGMEGLPLHISLDPTKNQKVDVLIKDVVDQFTHILNENKGKRIILKIDCEGAEYEIIDRLTSANLIDQFTCIMIEWHVKGAKELLEKLSTNGYSIFSFNEHNSTIGMIYATKI